ncbi:MAG: thioredoxin family protein [Terriglobia bacterium]
MTRKAAAMLATVFLAVAMAACAAGAQIYDDNANAGHLIDAAIREASISHKNIVLDFGANWCPDCHALDAQMHQGELAQVISKYFVIVHISVGRYDRNLEAARKYEIPLRKGIPALAVLDSHGKLLYSQKEGQFENARAMGSASFLAFFKKWEPKA